MKVGLLGLQGAFLDHIPHLDDLGITHTIVRDARALAHIDRLIIPGGESTVMRKFLCEFGMLSPLKRRIAEKMPVWGVCAGAILLSETVDGTPGPLGVLPIEIKRNAYGRQINSNQHLIEIPLFEQSSYPAVFIRAPRIDRMGPQMTVHATFRNDPVFIQNGHIMATTFHPELNKNPLFHKYFLSL